MEFKRYGDTYMVRIDVGEEIMETLMNLCEAEDIRLAQVDAIGASERAVLGVYDLEHQCYCRNELIGIMEITSLSGNITQMNGRPYIHLHTTVTGDDQKVHGGHVISMRVGMTCEMFVRVLDGDVTRERDANLGINLWKLN